MFNLDNYNQIRSKKIKEYSNIFNTNKINYNIWPNNVSRSELTGELKVNDISIKDIVNIIGTPLYIIVKDEFDFIVNNFKNSFKKAFESFTKIDIYYAGKAFLCTEIARWIIKAGLRLDVCSAGELAVAKKANIPGKLIALHGNNKSKYELEMALEMDVGKIIIDNFSEINQLSKISVNKNVRSKVMLRIKPGIISKTHEFIATAHEDQKFGFSLIRNHLNKHKLFNTIDSKEYYKCYISDAEIAIIRVLKESSLDLIGLHFHIGSQIFKLDDFILSTSRLIDFIQHIKKKYNFYLKELSIGGGYGIAYLENEQSLSPENIAKSLSYIIRKKCEESNLEVPRISIEPGRSIIGKTTFTIYKVGNTKKVYLYKKNIDNHPLYKKKYCYHKNGIKQYIVRNYISINGGMGDNPRPLLYDSEYSVILASRKSNSSLILSRIVGRYCESGDILIKKVYLPNDLKKGDLLGVPCTGAYCYSLSNNYNYVPRPPIISIEKNQCKLIIRRETSEDMLLRESNKILTLEPKL